MGNTSVGIYKATGPHPEWDPTVFIDVSAVPELLVVKATDPGLEIGAANTLRCLVDMLRTQLAAHAGTATAYVAFSLFLSLFSPFRCNMYMIDGTNWIIGATPSAGSRWRPSMRW